MARSKLCCFVVICGAEHLSKCWTFVWLFAHCEIGSAVAWSKLCCVVIICGAEHLSKFWKFVWLFAHCEIGSAVARNKQGHNWGWKHVCHWIWTPIKKHNMSTHNVCPFSPFSSLRKETQHLPTDVIPRLNVNERVLQVPLLPAMARQSAPCALEPILFGLHGFWHGEDRKSWLAKCLIQ